MRDFPSLEQIRAAAVYGSQPALTDALRYLYRTLHRERDPRKNGMCVLTRVRIVAGCHVTRHSRALFATRATAHAAPLRPALSQRPPEPPVSRNEAALTWLKSDRTFCAGSYTNSSGTRSDLTSVSSLSRPNCRGICSSAKLSRLGVARPHPAKYPTRGGGGISVSSGSTCRRRLISI